MMFLASFLIGSSCLAIFQDFGLVKQNTAVTQTIPRNRYKVYQEQVTWETASQNCGSDESKLVEILTFQQQKDLRKYLREYDLLPLNAESGYWIGGISNDRAIWRWETSGKSPRASNHFMAGWHFGEPDAKKNRNGISQQCMELQYRTGSNFVESLSWNDMWCDERRGYICESWDSNPIIN